MPALAFVKVATGWEAQVTQSAIRYPLVGPDEAGQLANLQKLANVMKTGEDQALFEALPECIELPEGMTGAAAAQTLMGTTNELMLGGDVIFTSEAGDVLGWLEVAGEDLVAALA